MKIDTARRESGDKSSGDERRFVVGEIVERVIIPRDLKEKRSRLLIEIAQIEATLAKLEEADK